MHPHPCHEHPITTCRACDQRQHVLVDLHRSVEPVLRPSLVAIVSISRLSQQLSTAIVPYNQENKNHEERLLHV
jgi:hypothetical protein